MKLLAYLLVALSCASANSLRREPGGQVSERPARTRLAPKFMPGQTFHYQLDSRTSREGDTSGVIDNPLAPKKTEISISAIVRFDVLRVIPEAAKPDSTERARLRATYEKVATSARADVYDPQLAESEAQLRKLEGRSIEFTVAPDGKAAEIEGLNGIFPEDRAAVRDLLAQLSLGVHYPGEGILPGQKWTAEQPLASAPFVDLFWRIEATYLRNEPCRPGAPPPAGSRATLPMQENCALLLTRFELAQRGKPHDPTPEEYRQRGLRTAGKMSGTGESLTYISLATGLVVSITHSGAQETNLTVSTADGESSLRQQIKVRSQSQITLLPQSPAASR